MPQLLDAPLEPDPVIEAYAKDVDLTLLRENLKLTPWQRLMKHQRMLVYFDRMRGRARNAPPCDEKPS